MDKDIDTMLGVCMTREQRSVYESLCKDAKRYRWLINKLPPGTFYDADVYDVDSWASAIDAAMAQESGR